MIRTFFFAWFPKIVIRKFIAMKYIYLPLMRTNNALTLCLVVILMVLTASQASAQTSKAITGSYEADSCWVGTKPTTDGIVNNSLMIVSGANITRNGNLLRKNIISLNGKLTVTGNYSETSWNALTINSSGELVVNGSFSTTPALTIGGKLTVNGIVTLNSSQAFTIASTGNATFNSGFTSPSTTVINGMLNVAGATEFKNTSTINPGATVNITGAFKSPGITQNGNLVVSGNTTFTNSVTVGATASTSIGGTLAATSLVANSNVTIGSTATITNTLEVNAGSVVEIFGDFSGQDVSIAQGGMLIVHGNTTIKNGLTVTGNFVNAGNIEVKGGMTVNSTGNLVVGGSVFTSKGWSNTPAGDNNVYILNPNAEIKVPNNTQLESPSNYGDINAFLANESNSALADVVSTAGLTSLVVWYSTKTGNWSDSQMWSLKSDGSFSQQTPDGKTITPGSTSFYMVRSGDLITIPSDVRIVTAGKITINTTGSLTLSAGGKLTVAGNITNNGTFNLQHSTSSPSSFINNGNIIGNTTVTQILEGGRAWYVGSPMTYSASVLSSATPLNTGGTRSALEYNTATKNWSALVNSTSMKGFAVNLGAGGPFTVTQTGSLYNGVQQIGLVSSGDRWNLVANPFASYVTLVNPTNNINHLTNPNWDFTNIEPTVYVRAKEGAAYKFLTFNLSTNVGSTGFENGLIAPMQSFWVKAAVSSNGFIAVKPSARTHPAAPAGLKSASVSEEITDILRIQSSNANATDEAIIVFRSIGSDTDTDFDSEKRVDSPGLAPQIFTLKSSKNIAINVMPEDPTPYTIPLAITVGEQGKGDITLNASNIRAFMPDVDVYVRDLITGTEVNLRETPQFTFNTAAATAQTRFELYFAKKAQQSLGAVTGTEVTIGSGVVITALGVGNKGIVTVKDAAFSGEVSIDIYDAQGRLCQHYQSVQSRTEVDLSTNTPVVIIKVSYKDQTKSFKIMKSMRF